MVGERDLGAFGVARSSVATSWELLTIVASMRVVFIRGVTEPERSVLTTVRPGSEVRAAFTRSAVFDYQEGNATDSHGQQYAPDEIVHRGRRKRREHENDEPTHESQPGERVGNTPVHREPPWPVHHGRRSIH